MSACLPTDGETEAPGPASPRDEKTYASSTPESDPSASTCEWWSSVLTIET